jgi:excisionase family DNA binding protein
VVQEDIDMSDANDKISYRVDEAVKASGLGRSFLYEKMAEGLLRSVKIGGRRLILRADLLAFINHGTSTWQQEHLPSPAVSARDQVIPAPAQSGQLELPFNKL